MKGKLKVLLVTLFLITAPLLILAQSPPHPNNGNAPTHGTNGPVGGGAPIDHGVYLLAAMGAAYGLRKFYGRLKRKTSDIE
ncbi:MAG: hypothetical protein WCM93_14625 [Bacteroidota bacterium]